ncbi:hypothetical protein HY68_12420 [Streptomyces sp. AcH 505]|uniref:YfbM family protein n=1 Tax=Streptomyces sp. AcH 505 TaxID=352211 RepID=UPI000591FDEC|nr:hypothetical protein HY68_12420 [Streptomyces sp. AcH 505]
MSMIGEYFRVSATELRRAVHDPGWALDFIVETQDAEDQAKPAPAPRHFSTYKTWDLLRFLLRRADFPIDVIHGEEPLAKADDWGYGPPRHLPVERVHLGATLLARTTYDHLIANVDPQELSRADVYPSGWETPASLEWGHDYYAGLTQFFNAAARSEQAVLVWLD